METWPKYVYRKEGIGRVFAAFEALQNVCSVLRPLSREGYLSSTPLFCSPFLQFRSFLQAVSERYRGLILVQMQTMLLKSLESKIKIMVIYQKFWRCVCVCVMGVFIVFYSLCPENRFRLSLELQPFQKCEDIFTKVNNIHVCQYAYDACWHKQ